MPELYGHRMTREDVESHSGNLSHAAGVRSLVLADGSGHGVRLLEFRTGSGLSFTVLVDRAMDIGDCEHSGRAIGWHSPVGVRHPALHEYEGEGGLGWLRSFSGLMVTCGLDHTLFMSEAPADDYVYGPREKVRHSLHGRIGTIPARLGGYGERWDGDTCVLWAEGVVSQGAVFGEHLELHRRIEADVGGDEIRLTDRVVNRGFYRTPHMLCYHINVGHPVLEEGARYLAPIADVVWAAHAGEYERQGVGYDRASGPVRGFHEQVWQHEMAADGDGRVPVALVNDRLGVGFMVTTRKEQFPCQFEWQNFQAGQYALGIEPSTHHVLGDGAARERGEMIWLEHADARDYDTVLTVLPDRDAIAAAERRIASITHQPAEPYPEPSGTFLPLGGGGRA